MPKRFRSIPGARGTGDPDHPDEFNLPTEQRFLAAECADLASRKKNTDSSIEEKKMRVARKLLDASLFLTRYQKVPRTQN